MSTFMDSLFKYLVQLNPFFALLLSIVFKELQEKCSKKNIELNAFLEDYAVFAICDVRTRFRFF